jgi:Tfp pilus assembly protein PilF
MKKLIFCTIFVLIAAACLPALLNAQDQPQSQPATESMKSTGASIEPGMRLYRQGRYAAAIAEFDRILQTDPNNAAAHYFSGYAHYVLKHHPESIAEFKKAFEADPNFDPRPYFKR